MDALALDLLNIQNAYDQLNDLPPNMLVTTIFRDLMPSEQAHLIKKRREAANIAAFVKELNEPLQMEMNFHFTTVYRQKNLNDITLP